MTSSHGTEVGSTESSLRGRTVVIAGASSGMGLATAHAALAQGADVTILARDEGPLRQAAAALGAGAHAVATDATDEEAVDRLFDDLGSVDHVVSFTGQQTFGPVAELDRAELHRSIDARVWAARNLCRAAAPRMRSGGSFTFCSGTSAWRPQPNRGAGAASTAAIESFGRAMAIELAPLRVNTVCPGVIDTPVTRRAVERGHGAMLATLRERIPLGRLGEPDEVAHAVVFLMTNSYVTGIVLHVDGGLLRA